MEELGELVNNNRKIVAVLIIIYVNGVLYKIIRNIFKERNNKKR